jgi:hypothetical protein
MLPRALNDGTDAYRPSDSGVSLLNVDSIYFAHTRIGMLIASCVVYPRIVVKMYTLREFRVA